jgi:cyclic pyranopterin monophosphate synthase
MVDVSDKPVTQRVAVASGRVCMSQAAFDLALGGSNKKGDVRGVAQIAGIMAGKKTADLIPLCHPLPLTSMKVEIEPDATGPALIVTARAKTTGQTGVEMEALTAVSVACLTIYDMLKAVDKTMVIEAITLLEKSGGRSGLYQASAPED